MRLKSHAIALLLASLASLAGQVGASDLLKAYELARVNDPQLAAAEARAAAAAAGIDVARGALLPQVAASTGITENVGDSVSIGVQPDPARPGTVIFGRSIGSADTRARTTGVNLRQSLYDHADYTRLRAARARAAEAETARLAAEQELGVRVARAYFGVLTAIESLAAARAQESASKRQLDQAETRLEVGLAPITDVHEARAAFDGARANAISATILLDDANEALAEITGEHLQGLRGLSKHFQPQLDDSVGLTVWVDRAMLGNATLQSAQMALDAAEANTATARAGHLPTVDLHAGWNDSATWGGRGAGAVTFPADAESDGYNVGVTLTVPIFSGGAIRAGVRQALALRDASADTLEQTRRGVLRQTRNAYRSLSAGAAEVEARRLALVSAQAALEAGEAGLEVGTRTIVDVLLAQQVLFTARTQWAAARHNFVINELVLQQAVGALTPANIEAVNRLLVSDAEAVLDATR